ncbi:uncharacterized protein BDR25DRAFT_337570 [Lindgomyces ingoldianus]|uniref:Uncharacterized protein n=1 Tax=Lindgomyces ingoldianus TaxID=673940 RepID=A0ACB6QD45_9PLEO|nr:uncharacterized protein BDR25DRAFT_337570 [Lindgomyces ingoldianus]KAF2464032.1 hypothetical protein BDR25DRAFT_337570 [Lindgomyces ingoldianus]
MATTSKSDSESTSPQAPPPLALPPAGLHFAPDPPHPDSEEFWQNNRFRTAQELEPIYEARVRNPDSSAHLSPNALTTQPGHSPTIRSRGSPSIRSRGPSIRSYNSRPFRLRRYSDLSTVTDAEGPDAQDARRYRLRRQMPHWSDPIVKIWKSEVSVAIDDGAHRDHLALERTFLGYLRTSLALAMTGVLTAQLFRLQHSVNPSPTFGFFVLGIPLAATFIGFGMIVLLIGAFRFWRQQRAMIRGKIYAGGWEIAAIMGLSIVLCTVAFVLITAVDIDKTYF